MLDTEISGYFIKTNKDYIKTSIGEIYKHYTNERFEDFYLQEIYGKIYTVEKDETIEILDESINIYTLEDFAKELLTVDVVVGFNILFDLFVLTCLLNNSKIENRKEAIEKIQKIEVHDLQKYSYRSNTVNTSFLSLNKYYTNLTGKVVEKSKLHTAEYDTYLTWAIYEYLLENFKEKEIFKTNLRFLSK